MRHKQKVVKSSSAKAKSNFRKRVILYVSAFSVGLPLLLANVYLNTQQTTDYSSQDTQPAVVLGDSTQTTPVPFSTKRLPILSCEVCRKALHQDSAIVLQSLGTSSNSWGALCVPIPALTGTPLQNAPRIVCPPVTLTPKPKWHPTITPWVHLTPRPTERPHTTPNQEPPTTNSGK